LENTKGANYKMKKEMMQRFGNFAGKMAKEGINKSIDNKQTTGKFSGNIADFAIDQISNALGGNSFRKSSGGRGGQGGGCGNKSGRGGGGGQGGVGGRRGGGGGQGCSIR